ncbi:MAG: dihydropteroate synthase [Candidatus Scalindua sp.]|nr:dihydropteroate synthase [Candidatus Scalindua sp.]
MVKFFDCKTADRLFRDRQKTLIMGTLNVTPDSFYDGGRYHGLESALGCARGMIEDGADIIDVGGVSTRPGSKPVSDEEELKRVIPVIKELSRETDKPISVDTFKAKVADKAISAGAQIVNDISGLSADSEMAKVVAAHGTPVVIMHIKGQPHNFPKCPEYGDLISEINLFFKKKIVFALESGISDNNIILDPGIGFGKTTKQNLEILRRLDEFNCHNYPIMVGTSRKSFIGKVLKPAEEDGHSKYNAQFFGTLVTLVIAMTKGVKIVRVHDVKEAVYVKKMFEAIVALP